MNDAGALHEDPTIWKSRNTAEDGRPHAMNTELKPDYKQTEVGVIPEDWDTVSLGAVTSDIGDGIHATPVYSSTGDYYFINGNNLRAGQIVVTEETKTIDHSEFRKHRQNLGDRSILMSINDSVDLLLFLENFRKIGLVTSILTMAAFSENHQDLTKSTESLMELSVTSGCLPVKL